MTPCARCRTPLMTFMSQVPPGTAVVCGGCKEKLAAEVGPTGGCPCLYVGPCHDRCACRHPLSSSGCRWCCSHGSLEQRTEMAGYLAVALRDWTRYITALTSTEDP